MRRLNSLWFTMASALILLGLGTQSAFATATITIVNGDPAGVGFNETTPATPVGGNTGTTLGEQRLKAFQAAADKWGATITSSVPIRIQATWEPLFCQTDRATLGSAGSTEIFANFPNAPYPGTWFSKSLANKLSAADRDSAAADIRARFNINLGNPGCLDGTTFYLGLDGNHGNNVDLVTVLTHEFAHGLGFQTFTASDTGVETSSLPSVYDRFLIDLSTGKLWYQMTDAERKASAVNDQNLAWNGPQVATDVTNLLGNPRLKVNSPAAIAGNYGAFPATFGAKLTTAGVTAAVVQALDAADGAGPTNFDGCSAFTNAGAVSGKIALIDRGTCAFVVKVKNAQLAGAIGVIIADNQNINPTPSPGGTDATITIPSVAITQANGNTLKAQLAASLNATIGLDPTVPAGADNLGRALMYAPTTVAVGSSVSHWDVSDFPNQLMEPNNSADLTHEVTPPNDLTYSLLRDVGWAANTTTPADLTVASSHTGNFTQGQTAASYSINVGNNAGPSIGSISVTDHLPTGLTATAISGVGWSCDLPTLTCTRVDVLPQGKQYPAIAVTVNVAGNAPATVTNNVVVSGGGDSNAGNNSANDLTNVTSTSASIQFSSATFTGSEASGFATLNVTRSGGTSATSTVDFVTSDGTALQSSDYETESGTLTFAPGDTSKSFNVLINQDTIVDPNETFTVTLSNPNGGSIGAQSAATVTITDDDSASTVIPTQKIFVADIRGGNVAPTGTNSPGIAAALLQLSQDETSATISLSFTASLSSSETTATINGPAGPTGTGPVIAQLPLGGFQNTDVLLAGNQAQLLKSGQLYITISSQAFPNGEIRGQLYSNPMDDVNTFVRQQYYDFLARIPDDGGFTFWTGQITAKGTDPLAVRTVRVGVSNAFFFEPEFQQTGSYVFRLYREAYGNNQPFPNPDITNIAEAKRLPSYQVFSKDRSRVIGGTDLAQGQLDLANQFVQRPEFIAKYALSLDGPAFVDKLLSTLTDLGVDLSSQRTALINLFNTGGRGAVVYRLADENSTNPIVNQAFIDEEYNRAFVATQYFGYLRRDADIGGFLFWQTQMNAAPLRNVPRQNALVCSFITSVEYQARFSTFISRFNNECPQ